MDLNIDDYTIDDLLAISHLPEDASIEEVRAVMNKLINKFRAEDNIDMVNFFIKARQKIIQDIENQLLENTNGGYDDPDENQVWQNVFTKNTNVTNKNELSDQYILSREQVGARPTLPVEVAPGERNPNLITITEKILSIDSRLRTTIFPHVDENPTSQASATSFDVILSSPLKDCLSIQLNSVVIPKTWYNVESGIGTNVFWVNGNKIEIEPGYYDASGLADAINEVAVLPLTNVSYNPKTGKFTFNFINLFPTPLDVELVFWDRDGIYSARNLLGCNQAVAEPKIDFNLGYMMGFREQGSVSSASFTIDVQPNNTYSLTPDAVADLEGTKNVYILVEDHNQNRLNSQVIPMAQKELNFVVPPINNKDISYVCLPGTNKPFYFSTEITTGVTQAKLYSINASTNFDTEQLITRDRIMGPQQANLLAVVPVASSLVEWGKNIVVSGPELTSNKRVYFGPVSLNKLSIRLVDDLGNVVNLHGRDWSFTMLSRSLYQY